LPTLCPAVTNGYAVGIINFRSYDDLHACLDALKVQTRRPDATLIVDVDPDGSRSQALFARPDLCWHDTENRGYAGGANLALRELCERTESEFLLLLTPDTRLEPAFADELVRQMARHPRAALATGKLLRPDGSIDSAGITLPRNRRPRDRGSGQPDRGQYDRVETVFGASGAAMLLRRAALADLAIDGELFDEDFFLYHEDTDLSWRAELLGWSVVYVPQARAVHDRRWQPRRRFDIEASVRRHSFKNHYLQLIKNEQARDFLLGLPILLAWEVLRLGFAVFRDPVVLPGYLDALRLSRRAWRKRRVLRAAMRRG
jgi:GT2 family glycosyltransferase